MTLLGYAISAGCDQWWYARGSSDVDLYPVREICARSEEYTPETAQLATIILICGAAARCHSRSRFLRFHPRPFAACLSESGQFAEVLQFMDARQRITQWSKAR